MILRSLIVAVAVSLPLAVEIGNACVNDVFPGNGSWADYEQSPLWYPFLNASHERNAVSVVTADYLLASDGEDSGVRPLWTASTGPHALENCAEGIYWQWGFLASSRGDGVLGFFAQDTFGILAITIEINEATGELFVDYGTSTATITYSSTEHRWWRIVEDSGEVYIQVAAGGDAPWTTLYTYAFSPAQKPFAELDNVFFDFYIERDATGAPAGEDIGWISPINPVPVPRELPLRVAIDERYSTLTRALPLVLEVG